LLESIGEKLDELEDVLFARPTRESLQQIQNIKRELIVFRRTVFAERDKVNDLLRSENDFVNKKSKHLQKIVPGDNFLFPVLICISIPAKLVTLLLGSNALIILSTSVCRWDFEPIGREFWTSSIVSIVTAIVAFVGTALQTIVWVKWHKLKVLKKELKDNL
jgi:hypothetical protein